ncbi:hypothetical protein CHU32_00895 [Superficieibacter electus]|uniref:DUF2314 domain-containing protein n=1 Tax=Superficieibacter electus TaxID=2022662 RepID=A0A2P5GW13_9ENTR|nr:DUF2314 domain-containing protein [Superficieibacter electus]POP47733.1 hypothetical protein CHU33_00895 [Superficieibacter electus]POP50745.1 hypothetical protein CHU32_00895 [Superficieibacter electus]
MKSILLTLSLLFFTTAGYCQLEDKVITEGYDQQEMSAAIAHARRETDTFIKMLNKHDADSYAVKAPITDGKDTEHFWLSNVSYADGIFTGIIANDPGIVKNVEYGQEWKIKKEDISDWMYTRGDKIYGGYTIDPLLATYPKEEADGLRARLVR